MFFFVQTCSIHDTDPENTNIVHQRSRGPSPTLCAQRGGENGGRPHQPQPVDDQPSTYALCSPSHLFSRRQLSGTHFAFKIESELPRKNIIVVRVYSCLSCWCAVFWGEGCKNGVHPTVNVSVQCLRFIYQFIKLFKSASNS